MPWTCCDVELSDDLHACPGCGGEKATWTVRFQRTRVFAISTRAWVDVGLVDDRGRPRADEV
ncbi:MAG: hypothetical protein KIT58_19125, partial [Planctomycetota bacterium]|nr:hypothetical protein [Planctomycetota bacterium]